MRATPGLVPSRPRVLGKALAHMFLVALTSLSNTIPQSPQRYTRLLSGMGWRCPQAEQSVVVLAGFTLT